MSTRISKPPPTPTTVVSDQPGRSSSGSRMQPATRDSYPPSPPATASTPLPQSLSSSSSQHQPPPPQQYRPTQKALSEDEGNNKNNDEKSNVKVVTSGGFPSAPKKQYDDRSSSSNPVITFIRKNPIVFVLIMSIIIVVIVLAIVLPLTLVKPKAERPIKPQCPDGRTQPRIDCLPDRVSLAAAGANLEATCRQRACCWSTTPEGGGPNCAFHHNYGFKRTKVKESSSTGHWYELTRMEAPGSLARSDIANLEFKVEMQTDFRLRIKVNYYEFLIFVFIFELNKIFKYSFFFLMMNRFSRGGILRTNNNDGRCRVA